MLASLSLYEVARQVLQPHSMLQLLQQWHPEAVGALQEWQQHDFEQCLVAVEQSVALKLFPYTGGSEARSGRNLAWTAWRAGRPAQHRAGVFQQVVSGPMFTVPQ
jgi:hypothetical protein